MVITGAGYAWWGHGRRQQQAAGVWGEDKLAGALSVLPDEWVMLRGYRN